MAVGTFFNGSNKVDKSRELGFRRSAPSFKIANGTKIPLGEMEESLITADVGVKATDVDAGAAPPVAGRKRRFRPGNVGQTASGHGRDAARLGCHTQTCAVFGAPWGLFSGRQQRRQTTTIGKLAAQYRNDGKKVLLVAGDTFRAAAVNNDAW
jgi:fused signal recognition particle receptor